MKSIYLSIALYLFGAVVLGQPVTALDEIEQRYQKAMENAFATGTNEISPIIEQLDVAYQDQQDYRILYWQAYGHYMEGVFYITTDQMDKGSETVAKGIARLETMKEHTAESHVLLGSLSSFLISFNPGKAMTLSRTAQKHYNKALKLDDQCMRAYLALGKSDFYTPEEYGGGKKAEEYFLKALSLEDTYSEDPYAPTWGRDEVYMHLVQLYMRQGRMDEAKLYCKQGLEVFPEEHMLNELAKELL